MGSACQKKLASLLIWAAKALQNFPIMALAPSRDVTCAVCLQAEDLGQTTGRRVLSLFPVSHNNALPRTLAKDMHAFNSKSWAG